MGTKVTRPLRLPWRFKEIRMTRTEATDVQFGDKTIRPILDDFSKMMTGSVVKKTVQTLLMMNIDLSETYKIEELVVSVSPEGGEISINGTRLVWTGIFDKPIALWINETGLLDLHRPGALDRFIEFEKSVYDCLEWKQQEISTGIVPKAAAGSVVEIEEKSDD